MYKQIDSNKRRTWVLMIVFVIIIAAFAYVYEYYYGTGSYSILIGASILAIFTSLFGFYSGDKVALTTSGAKKIEKKDNPYVYRMVENLSITAGLPTPKVYIIPDKAINAFATGRDPKHASIAVTQGAIDKLANEELEGVIAHELAHVKNYDIRLMTIVIICVGLITLLADIFWRARLLGLGNKKDNNSGQAGAIIMIVGLVFMILSPVFARLIQLAVSRRREFLADASGAMLTRYPEGLAGALEKIKLENKQMRRKNKATAHLFLASPFGNFNQKVSKLFSTHPPIDERIAKLTSKI